MIKKARKKQGITQEMLANKIGITQSYLSKLESKNKHYTNNITINLIFSFSEALNLCPIKLFIYFTDHKIRCKLNCHNCEKML